MNRCSPLRRSPRSGAVAAALALTLALGAGCGGTSGARIGVREATARVNAEGVQVVDVDVHSFYFDPNRITVEAGTPVELVLHFKPLFVPHNVTCEAPEAGIEIDRSIGIVSFDRTKHVRFTPTKRGEYGFYCGVGGHMKKGMTGTFVVR
jgi:plastocyanin